MSKYADRYGDLWTRLNPRLLRRDKDGNIGGWFNGYGLERI